MIHILISRKEINLQQKRNQGWKTSCSRWVIVDKMTFYIFRLLIFSVYPFLSLNIILEQWMHRSLFTFDNLNPSGRTTIWLWINTFFYAQILLLRHEELLTLAAYQESRVDSFAKHKMYFEITKIIALIIKAQKSELIALVTPNLDFVRITTWGTLQLEVHHDLRYH